MEFLKKYPAAPAAVAALFHGGLSIFRYWVDQTNILPFDYRLGLIAAVLTGFIILAGHFRPQSEPGQAMTVLMVLFLFLSCAVATLVLGENMFYMNRIHIYDTIVTLLFFYPLGRFLSRQKKPVILRLILHAILAGWTLFMIVILPQVSAGKVFEMPSGESIQIGVRGLELGCNSNTTGLIQMLVIMLALLLAIGDALLPLRVFCLLALIPNIAGLLLSSSRTSLFCTVTGCACMLFVFLCREMARWSRNGKIGRGMQILLYVLFAGGLVCLAIVTLLREKKEHKFTVRVFNWMLNGRLEIWAASFKAMTLNAQRMLTGTSPCKVFSAVREASDGKFYLYTHNQFLEIGVTLGIPCLLVFILFLLWTGRNSVRLFRRPQTTNAVALLPVMGLILLGANITEATLLFYQFPTAYVFFFICGWINEEGRRRLPRKKTGRVSDTGK